MSIEVSPATQKSLARIQSLLSQMVEEVEEVDDGLERIKLETLVLDALRDATYQLSEYRRETAFLLNKVEGQAYSTLADELGMSRGRIQQFVTGIQSPRRPGVIEADMRVRSAEMRAAGASDSEIVRQLVPAIRERRSGERLTLEQVASMLGVSESQVEPTLHAVDQQRKLEMVGR